MLPFGQDQTQLTRLLYGMDWVVGIATSIGGVVLFYFGENSKGLGIILLGSLFFPFMKSPQWLKLLVAATSLFL